MMATARTRSTGGRKGGGRGRLGVLIDRLENPDRVLGLVGNYLERDFRESFNRQGIGNQKWPERKRLSIPAVADELFRGPSIHPLWFDTQPTGKGPGNELENSIKYRVVSKTRVEVGSWLTYAASQQLGGVRRVDITSAIKRNLATYLAGAMPPKKRGGKLSGGGQTSVKNLSRQDVNKLAGMFRRDSYTVNIPPRPFAVLLPEHQAQIRKMVSDFIMGV